MVQHKPQVTNNLKMASEYKLYSLCLFSTSKLQENCSFICFVRLIIFDAIFAS